MPISGTFQFVVLRLGLVMINRHTKFEVSAIACNEGMKGNAKICKNFVLSHHLVELGVTHEVQHCRLPISDDWTFFASSHAEALLSEICRNRRFQKGLVTLSGYWSKSFVFKRGWVSLSTNLRGNGASPTNDWAITRRCFRDPTFSRLGEYRRVTDGWTRWQHVPR